MKWMQSEERNEKRNRKRAVLKGRKSNWQEIYTHKGKERER